MPPATLYFPFVHERKREVNHDPRVSFLRHVYSSSCREVQSAQRRGKASRVITSLRRSLLAGEVLGRLREPEGREARWVCGKASSFPPPPRPPHPATPLSSYRLLHCAQGDEQDSLRIMSKTWIYVWLRGTDPIVYVTFIHFNLLP